jgi:hypothetical protein
MPGKVFDVAFRATAASTRERDAERTRAASAVDAMHAARPLRPPPMRLAAPTRSAAALALESDKRAGLLGGGTMYVTTLKGR